MLFPRIPLADLFLTEINNTGAVLLTQYVGLTYICGTILLYDILRVQIRRSIDICTLILLMVGFFHIYVYIMLDSIWMVYNLEDMIWLWDKTTIADKRIIEDNQKGVLSSKYQPGPLSTMELGVESFKNWYLETFYLALDKN